MPRPVFLTFVAASMASAIFALHSCQSEPVVAAPPAGSSADIVVLANGATMAAGPGTVERRMANWLTAARSAEADFALGDTMFAPGSARLTSKGLGYAATLATLLRATPDARIGLMGHGDLAGGAGAGEEIARQRAAAVAAFLEERGIAADRIAIAGAGARDRADGGQLTLVATRGPAPEPLLTASQ